MRVKRLIKRFSFEEDNRALITLGAGTRLDPDAHRLVLQGPPYSTDPDQSAETWVWNPGSVKQWLGFEAVVTHKFLGTTQLTGAGFRLSDGTDEYWWDGGAWAVSTTQWNTEVEVAANIPTFPVADQKLQVVVNLTTTDKARTPELVELKILWASDVEFLEDILYRSLVPALRDEVRPISDYLLGLGTGPTSSIDLNDFPLETPYNLVDIDSVFDHSADPKHLTDLLDSYDPGTKVITLSAPIPDENLGFVRFLYEPEVAVTTSQDYTEISKVPALVLDDVNEVGMTQRGIDDWIVNKSVNPPITVKVPAPMQGDLEIVMHTLTDKGVDQKRLTDRVKAFFANNPTLRSTALDERFTLWLIDEYDMRTPPGKADQHTGSVRFRIRDVVSYVRDAVDGFGVKRFLATGTEDFVLGE